MTFTLTNIPINIQHAWEILKKCEYGIVKWLGTQGHFKVMTVWLRNPLGVAVVQLVMFDLCHVPFFQFDHQPLP